MAVTENLTMTVITVVICIIVTVTVATTVNITTIVKEEAIYKYLYDVWAE